MEPTKEIRADAKLKSLSQATRDELWRMRYPEEDGEKVKFTAILAWLKHTFALESSLASLSDFYAWERMARRIQHAKDRAEQVRMEMAKDSNITPDDLERVAQSVFTAETLAEGDIKNYVALATLRLNRQRVNQDERKLELLEKKAAFADAVKQAAEASAGGITAEQMAEIERKLKLM